MENTPPIDPDKFFKTACYFEGSLILVAIVLGWVADIDPFENIHFSELAVVYGVIGTIPLILLFLSMEFMEIESLQEIRKILIDTLGPSLQKQNWADFFILAMLAGISEEILFRGVIQPWMELSWGMTAGLIASSLLFGFVHAVTPLYIVIATLMSIYLGLALDYGGQRNLLTPVLIHGLYDFVAFILIMKSYRSNLEP